MKKIISLFKNENFLLIVASICAAIAGILLGSQMLSADILNGTSGGKLVTNEPLTLDLSRKHSPDFLQNEVDDKIVQIRPMSTPLDTITRQCTTKHAGSMIIDYYCTDVKPTKSTLTSAYTEPTQSNAVVSHQRAKLNTANNDLFEVSETILVQGVKGFDENGTVKSNADLVLYIYGKDEDSGHINVYAVNGKKIGNIENCVPSIPANTPLCRMGRASTELDVQTPQFEALPTKMQNYCQIFKAQFEESVFHRMANKGTTWKMTDMEEAATYEMRLGIEKSLLFGVKRQIYDSVKKQNVYLTGGVWWQAGKEFSYDPSTEMSNSELIDLMKEAFTGNGGSKKKVLIGGSDLIGRLNKLDSQKIVGATDKSVSYGLDFQDIYSKFGVLNVLFSEIFDECGMAACGIIIDPIFITKWTHQAMTGEDLNLKSTGIRNTHARVFTEASCVTLRYPTAHMRITTI